MQIETLFKISYGLYVISSKNRDNKPNGYVGNTAFQITASPAQIAIGCNKDNYTSQCIDDSGLFSISILPEDTDPSIFGTFGYQSGRDIEKFQGKDYMLGDTGCPILTENIIGFLECKVTNKVDVGTHYLYIGEVVEAKILNSVKQPMTYDYYHKVKNGSAPKNAPTYIDPELLEKTTSEKSQKYKCSVCGYTIDMEKGDPSHGIEPGQKFEDLPDNWVCPICGVSKDKFHAM